MNLFHLLYGFVMCSNMTYKAGPKREINVCKKRFVNKIMHQTYCNENDL